MDSGISKCRRVITKYCGKTDDFGDLALFMSKKYKWSFEYSEKILKESILLLLLFDEKDENRINP